MRTCLNCNSEFPTKVVIDGKRRNLCSRKFCFECSPFGSKNTKDLTKQDGNKNSKRVVDWRQRTKLRSIEYKGGSCQVCGYDRCIQALEFHHIDPTQKDFQISGTSVGWDKIQKELDKCVMVCANCHREIHNNIITLAGTAGFEPAD